jgi:hypothetical protein
MLAANATTESGTTPGTWGGWFSDEQGWSPSNFGAITGMQCRNENCDDQRFLYYAGIQGSQDPAHSQDSVLFSEDRTSTEGICPRNYIVTQAWCGGGRCDDLRLRCTQLEPTHEWAPGSDYEYWTENLSEENNHDTRSERYCDREGSVMVGLRCTSGSFCDNKQVLCKGLRRTAHVVSGEWRLYSLDGANTATSYTVEETTATSSEQIFSTTETWSIGTETTLSGTFRAIDGETTMTSSYERSTFQQASASYSASRTLGTTRTCASTCSTQGKNGWLYWQTVQIGASSDRLSFSSPPQCLVQCVTIGLQPRCPPSVCGDSDCQCCTANAANLLSPGYPICPSSV